jgi:hypothetical protein
MTQALRNWLCEPGRNPFNLQPPPESFLRELAVFDADLVIMPSTRDYGYWLLRRRKLTKGISTVLNLNTDSALMARHGLIPVTLFGGHVTWGPQVLQWLRDRDTWHVGGGEKAANIYEEQDRAAEAAIQRQIDSENDARARSMWRTYTTRNGSRVSLADKNRGRGPINTRKRTGSAPVPPAVVAPPPGWRESASGLITPPTHR